ncbi:MAG: phosphatase PAP2 family protein [Gammaproteobacteria bacterium]
MNEAAQQRPWYRQVAALISSHVLLKTFGTTLFIGVFFAAYFYLLKQPAFPTTVMPFIWLDRLFDFQPLALPLYISLWIYVSLPVALLATRRELFGYGLAMATTCLAGLIVFYFWPTAVPAAHVDWSRYPDVNFLKTLDATGNACPSLHVTTAIFSGIWLHHLLRRLGVPLWLLILNVSWCGGIVYSTLATRQHVAVDVLAGFLLGMMAAWLSLRYRVNTLAFDNISPRSIY